jgi:c-di-GMP-binding flagellar brake protein YcgR
MKLTIDLGVSDLDPYRVFARREIVSVLRGIGAQNQFVRMIFDDGADSVVTSILDVDEESGSVVIDVAPEEEQNRRIAASTDLAFDTSLDHIRIAFFGTQAELCEYDGLPAFRMDIPDSLIRLQRREFYRVATPVASPVRCTFFVAGADKTAASKTVVLPLKNISNGGIAVMDFAAQLTDTDTGRIYRDCRIDFPGSPVTVSLEIRNTSETALQNGKIARRIGCRFSDMSNQVQATVQRYILKLEREQNAKSTGMV